MNTSTLTAVDTQSSHRGLIIVTIMMVAILEVLDSTIVNVALPAMMPSLGANQNQITWVLTSYVVASAIMLPLTGFLSHRFGQKHLLLINITGFMVSSFLCGFAETLPEMVIFRVCQGMFGASLIPLSQSVLRQVFPLEEQGKAMAIWGIGIMAAPVFGPTLGGFITEHSSWRWVFYINVPFCVLGVLLTMMVIPDSKRYHQKIDWLGLILMVVGVGCLQIFLDKGNENDWLSSNFILALAVISAFAIVYFFIRSINHRYPVIKFSIFKNRNFFVSCLMMCSVAGSIFGLITLEPMMLENLFHYPAMTAGWTMAPLGAASAVGMVLITYLIKRVNIKIILSTGLLLCAYACFRFAGISLDADMSQFLINNALLGLGMGFIMVPLTTYSLATVGKQNVTEGAGLYAYSRMLGTSIGISLLSTLISRTTQVNWHSMAGHINAFNSRLHHWFTAQHLPFMNAAGANQLASQIQQQASMISFLDSYKLIAILFVLLVPLTLLIKTIKLRAGANVNTH